MKKTALNKLIGILIIALLLGATYSVIIASEGTQAVPDEDPPEISKVVAEPYIQNENGPVNISCTVTDNVMVQLVTENITYPDASEHNETMTYDNKTDLAYYNSTYAMIGNYTLYIWATDNSSNHNQSELYQFTIEELQNQAPNLPSNPFPADEATDVPLNTILTWEGGDPDGDIVYYDIFFGVNVSPPLVIENQENTTYGPDLEPTTKYYWQIIATDEHGLSALGQKWSFTTAQETGNITLELKYPSDYGIWRNGRKIGLGLIQRYIFYGPIEIEVSATSPSGIDYVTFQLGNRTPKDVNSAPYIFEPNILLSGKYQIEIKAYAGNGETATIQLEVFKWRIHPALIALGGVAALKGIANIAQGKPAFGFTIIRGTAINIKEQNNDLVFRAFRLHFTEFTGSSFSSGILRLKKVKISDVGINRMITLGPFGSFNFIFAICQGGLREV